jgi:hypothetical protein
VGDVRTEEKKYSGIGKQGEDNEGEGFEERDTSNELRHR